MKLRTGMYHYMPRGSSFRELSLRLCRRTPVFIIAYGRMVHTREEASRRVYELNGWKPKIQQK